MTETSTSSRVVDLLTKQPVDTSKGQDNRTLDTGGGGSDDGHMEARVAKLESAVEYIQRDLADIKATIRGHDGKFDGLRDRMDRDFRILFGAIITVSLGLAGLMAKGFGWL